MVGITVAARTNAAFFSIWNLDGDNEAVKMLIGAKLQEVLQLQAGHVISYKKHSDAMRDLSSYTNAKAYVVAAPPPAPTEEASKEEQPAET